MLKLTWMAAGALFLTLWSRFRDDRLERKGKLTEVHDRLAFSVEGRERVGEGAGGDGGRQDGQGQQTPPDVSGRKHEFEFPPRRLFRLTSVETGGPESNIVSATQFPLLA